MTVGNSWGQEPGLGDGAATLWALLLDLHQTLTKKAKKDALMALAGREKEQALENIKIHPELSL